MDPRIQIDSIGGNCPVQAEGMVDGKPFYFRARGSLTLSIADEPRADAVSVGDNVPGWEWEGTDDPMWIKRTNSERPFRHPYFGWLSEDAARECIIEVLTAYLAGVRDGVDGWTRHGGTE